MMGAFFTKEPVTDYETAKRSDTQRYAKFFHRMLGKGIYFAPSQFEAAFLSTAHTSRDVTQTVASASTVFRAL